VRATAGSVTTAITLRRPPHTAMMIAPRPKLPIEHAPSLLPALRAIGRRAMALGARLYLMSIELDDASFSSAGSTMHCRGCARSRRARTARPARSRIARSLARSATSGPSATQTGSIATRTGARCLAITTRA